MQTIGRYQIAESLGQGGMGAVYKAFDPLLARTVAVKIISTQLGGSPEHHERFFREARAAAHLSHRNIITIHDLGEENGVPFLAMEFLEGRDLDQKMRSGEPMTLARKLEIALGVCDGLGHAHACGVIHRDIKPANIFITNAGEVKILDFGLARLVTSEITRSNVMIGTVNYMAPEQIRGERTDHRADIFSLGAVLYELLGGRKAFAGDSFASTLYKIVHELPEPIEHLDPDLPPALAAIVGRAMAKSRDDRYQQVPDLTRDLEAVYVSTSGADSRFVRSLDSDGRPRPPTRAYSAVYEAETMAGMPAPEELRQPSSRPPSSKPPASRPASSRPPSSKPSASRPPSSRPAADVPGADDVTTAETMVEPLPPPRTRWPVLAAVVAVAIAAVALTAWWRGTAPSRGPSSAGPRAAPPVAVGPAQASPAPAPPPAAPAAPQEAGTGNRPVPSVGEVVSSTPTDPRLEERVRITRSTRAAKTAFEAGRHDEASQLVADVLRADPGNREALQLRARMGAEERARAERGVDGMDAGKRAALAAGASSLAPDLFRAAERSESGARQSFADRRYTEAAARADDALALFRDAEAAATRRAAADAERARAAAQEQRAERQDSKPLPPAPVTAPPPVAAPAPPPPAAPPPEQLVAAVVERYAAALEARDLGALRALWPSLGGAQAAAIRADFDNARSIDVSFGRLAIDVSGATATASGIRHYVVRTRDGHTLESDALTTVLLRKTGAQWVIDSIRYEPTR